MNWYYAMKERLFKTSDGNEVKLWAGPFTRDRGYKNGAGGGLERVPKKMFKGLKRKHRIRLRHKFRARMAAEAALAKAT